MNQANFIFWYKVITMIIVLVTTKEKHCVPTELDVSISAYVPSKLISTHCLSLASLSFLLSLTTTSVYAIAKTLKLHTKCSLLACCCIIMLIVLWSFKLWVKMFDHFFVEEYMTCWLGKNRNYIQNALPLQVVVSSWQLYWEVFIPGYILNS